MTLFKPEKADRTRILRIVAYYLLLAGAVALLVRAVPGVQDLMGSGGLGRSSGFNLFGDASAPVGVPVASTPWAGGLLGAVSMLGALAIMIPVTLLYMVTRRQRGFDESVVHTLLILPVAVTGIVMIVRDSVALAFSLAGIVAAVRFRTTLEDTKDAVYVFLAIGVGIASGVQALGLAMVLSLVFNAIILVLWTTRFGNAYAGAAAVPGSLALGEALAGPASTASRQLVGDPALLEAAAPVDIAQVLEGASRLERHLAEERGDKKSKRSNTLLLVAATASGPAQAAVEGILEESSERWRLAEVVAAPGGGWVLEYLTRIEPPSHRGALLDRIRVADPSITAVELRSLEGLRSWG